MVQAVNRPERFQVFTRQLLKLDEFYSVGLVLLGSPELNLLRYNGVHAPHTNPDGTVIERVPHIHKLDEQTLGAGIRRPVVAVRTQKYANFQEAHVAFLKDTNIQGWEAHWPELSTAAPAQKQRGLFDVLSANDS